MNAPGKEEEDLRKAAVGRLAAQMDRNARLIERCEALALSGEGDAIAALNAASRLMKADAAVAAMVARLGQVETRHRSLIDVNRPTKESQAELNRKKFYAGQAKNRNLEKHFWKTLDEHVSNAIRHRMGDATVEDRIAYALKSLDEWEEADRANGWVPEEEERDSGDNGSFATTD
ncbi:MAG TPA: hypothetical protein VGG69_12190 [Rhizomicrobium sp.]|jgi:hypothetical protein